MRIDGVDIPAWLGVFISVAAILGGMLRLMFGWKRNIEARQDACEGRQQQFERECTSCRAEVKEARHDQWEAINGLRGDTSEIKAGVARIEGALSIPERNRTRGTKTGGK